MDKRKNRNKKEIKCYQCGTVILTACNGAVYCEECKKERHNKSNRKFYHTHLIFSRDKNRRKAKRLRERRKLEIFNLYGNKCQKCGFSDFRALQIDHKNGGGAKERKKYVTTHRIYTLALKNPEKYQLLCANCNWIKKWENDENARNRLKE